MNTVEEILMALRKRLMVNQVNMSLAGRKAALVVVDEVNGFCKPGCGNLAPPMRDPMIESMISESRELAIQFGYAELGILILQECHEPGVLEPPYPAHCECGSGEEDLVPEIADLQSRFPHQTIVFKKRCINGVIGTMRRTSNEHFDQLIAGNEIFACIDINQVEILVVVGICTDVCVLQFVQTMLSARNAGFMPTLKEVVVYEPGCATYDLSLETVQKNGFPEHMVHDQAIAHHMGLYLMQMSGAMISSKITFN